MSQPDNPFAPPRSDAADARHPSPQGLTLETARRRAWRGLVLWLVGLSLVSGTISTAAKAYLRSERRDELLARITARVIIANGGARLAALSTAVAATIFVHHRLSAGARPERRFVGTLFAVSPVAAMAASVMALGALGVVVAAFFDVGMTTFVGGVISASEPADYGRNLAASLLYAACLTPFAMFVLPPLHGLVRRLALKVVVVWLVVTGMLWVTDHGLAGQSLFFRQYRRELPRFESSP